MTSGPKKYCEDNDVHHDGHSVRVATEVGNVVVDPLQRQQLQAGVRFVFLSARVNNISRCYLVREAQKHMD